MAEFIARTSRGSFRDAISLLEQSAATGEIITEDAVRKLVGQADPKILASINHAVADRQAELVLKALDQAYAEGASPAQLAIQIALSWRDRLRELLTNEDSQPDQIQLTARVLDALIPITKSPWPDLALEAALVGICLDQSDPKPIAPKVDSIKAAPQITKPAEPEPKAPLIDGADKDQWSKVLELIKVQNNSLYALLRASCTINIEEDEVILGCRFSFHRDRLRETKNLQIIEQSIARVYGRRLRVLAQLETKPTPVVADTSNELVSSALEILGGEVIE